MSGFSDMYCIFAEPRDALADQLRGEITHLASKYGTQPFKPHVTVLGSIERPREEVMALAREAASKIKPFRINLSRVAQGPSHYVCVYIAVAQEEGAMAAGMTARQVFGVPSKPYMPHLSLVYADMGDDVKAQAVEYENARLFGTDPATRILDTGFDVDRLTVWYVPEDDPSLASWTRVAEIPLSG
ncbi:hypothetical protein HYH03_009228 [Edaphochlamys debaryana]|uniref:Uncharacterized protein n=1 Tax=Edaphochlamys debaryana TaxID=47281 RepID=A0A836BXB6_9CHLO|nr:hypothetical protein HYH03_009228 [Edaphochlamys debaryana]|eukprot:KAG2492566.1 hypothetical protein HYH03_009228 [Edaphochlamys debaryana]